MKNYLLNLMVVITTFTVVATVSSFAFSGGDGSSARPYQIANRQDMEKLNDSVNNLAATWSVNKYFILTANIPATDPVISTVGSATFRSFRGNFDGQNFTIAAAIDNGPGLFYALQHITISNLTVTGYVTNANNIVGGIAGSMDTSIMTNCHNNAKIRGYAGGAGGLIGQVHSYSSVFNCTNGGTVQGISYIGGIAGSSSVDNVNITGCTNIGSIEGDNIVGGIVGDGGSTNRNANNVIQNCTNHGFIKGISDVGGIIGVFYGVSGNSTASNCNNTGVVSGNSNRGCIGGRNAGGTIINCHYDEQM
jgi:hypothetical protein